MIVTAPGILSTAFGVRVPVVMIVSIFSAFSSSSLLRAVCCARAAVANVAASASTSGFTAGQRMRGLLEAVFLWPRVWARLPREQAHETYFQKIVALSCRFRRLGRGRGLRLRGTQAAFRDAPHGVDKREHRHDRSGGHAEERRV